MSSAVGSAKRSRGGSEEAPEAPELPGAGLFSSDRAGIRATLAWVGLVGIILVECSTKEVARLELVLLDVKQTDYIGVLGSLMGS